MFKKIILTGIFIIATISTNAQTFWGNNNKIKGNGNVVTVNRTTSSYNGIGVGGSFDVTLVKGEEGDIKIEGEENIIPYIITEVSRNTLHIKYQKNTNIQTTKKLTVIVPFKSIETVSLGGSGNITNTDIIKSDDFAINLGGSGNITLNIDVDQVKTSIGGSGNINLSGTSNTLNCTIAGSGNVKAYDLKSDSLDATVAGSGNIKATVQSKINAKVVGSGSIFYKGNPKNINTKTVGSGDVINKN